MITPYQADREPNRSVLLVCGGDSRPHSLIAKLSSQMGCETREYDRLIDVPRNFNHDLVAGLLVVESPGRPNATAGLTCFPEELAWLPTIVLTVSNQSGQESIAIRTGTASQVLGLACNATDIGNTMERLRRNHEKRLSGQAMAYDLAAAKRGLESLNERHHAVLRMMLDGTLNKKMARELGISIRTVENCRSRIHKAAGVTSLAELVRVCVMIGYIDTFEAVRACLVCDTGYRAVDSIPATL